MIHKWFTGDSENDLKINIFLAAGESDVDLDADTDVVFKDPAQDNSQLNLKKRDWCIFLDYDFSDGILKKNCTF